MKKTARKKKQSVLNNQSVKKQKRKKDSFSFLRVMNRVALGFMKGSLLIFFVVMISVSFLFIYQYLVESPYMKLQEVDFQGVGPEIRRELIEMCGLHPELSLLVLRLNELKQKMEKHPWIRSVELERRFPHTLVVFAKKQVPSALVLKDGAYYMNKWGEIFKKVGGSEEMDLPFITGISSEQPHAKRDLIKAAHVIRILGSEEGPWSLKGLSEIHVNRDGSVSLYFDHLAAEVRSTELDLKMKLEGLKKVAEHLNRTGRINQVTGIDLNCLEGAVVSFRKS